MDVITRRITLDLYGPRLEYYVEAHEGDRKTRRLLITVTEDGKPYKLPDADFIAQIRRPDGVTVYKDCTSTSDNQIDLTLPANGLNVAGIAVCEIVINDAENEQTLTTQSFELEIHPSQGKGNTIDASDDLKSMEQQIEELAAAINKLEQTGNKMLPEVTKADNGKFLRVVNGLWAAAALTDVSEEGA